MYVLALNVRNYCMSYLVIVLSCAAFYPSECWSYEHLYSTDSDILFHLLLMNVLIVGSFG